MDQDFLFFLGALWVDTPSCSNISRKNLSKTNLKSSSEPPFPPVCIARDNSSLLAISPWLRRALVHAVRISLYTAELLSVASSLVNRSYSHVLIRLLRVIPRIAA